MATLTDTLYDPSGAVISGAQFTLTQSIYVCSVPTTSSITFTTDDNGMYSQEVRCGTYYVKMSLPNSSQSINLGRITISEDAAITSIQLLLGLNIDQPSQVISQIEEIATRANQSAIDAAQSESNAAQSETAAQASAEEAAQSAASARDDVNDILSRISADSVTIPPDEEPRVEFDAANSRFTFYVQDVSFYSRTQWAVNYQSSGYCTTPEFEFSGSFEWSFNFNLSSITEQMQTGQYTNGSGIDATRLHFGIFNQNSVSWGVYDSPFRSIQFPFVANQDYEAIIRYDAPTQTAYLYVNEILIDTVQDVVKNTVFDRFYIGARSTGATAQNPWSGRIWDMKITDSEDSNNSRFYEGIIKQTDRPTTLVLTDSIGGRNGALIGFQAGQEWADFSN